MVGGTANNQAKLYSDIAYFIDEAYKHYKPIGIATSGVPFFNASNAKAGPGIEFSSSNPEFGKAFVNIIAQQRFWNRDIY